VLIASSAAHSLLGWHFAGGSMLAMGIVTVVTFVGRLRGYDRSIVAPATFGVLYLAAEGINACFIGVFVVPGVLLLVASLGTTVTARHP